MLLEALKQIQEQSQLILSSTDRVEVPVVHRNIEQVEKEFKKMNERIKPNQELEAKAHYLLANSGIDTEHESPLNSKFRIFDFKGAEKCEDVRRALREEHERRLISVIEGQRTNNIEDFENFFEEQYKEFSTIAEQKVTKKLENVNEYKEFEKFNSSTGLSRIADYANVIVELNKNRQLDNDFDLIGNLSKIRNSSELKRAQDSTLEAWNLLNYLIQNSGVIGRLEGRFLKPYITEDYNSRDSIYIRRSLIQASKSWLEKQTIQYMNDTLNKNARKIQIGGIPSFSHRLRSFIDLVFKTATGWIDDRLELVDGLPIWVFIYLLLRTGHLDIAAKFVKEHPELFVTERKFVNYFEDYYNAKDHCVSNATQESILADYYKFEYGDKVEDPYKIIIYKVIGRCELHKRTLSDIIKSTEDFMWLQFALVREVPDADHYEHELYRLVDVQNHVLSYGSKCFDPEESNPWIFFKILLMTFQFEKAIQFLYDQKHLGLETVHFAIALLYYGLLRVKSTQKPLPNTLVVQNDNKTCSLDIEKLLCQYVQIYLSNHSKQSIDYLCLFTLYSPKQGYPNLDMVQLAKTCICDYAIQSQDFKSIIGTLEKERTPGLIEMQSKLLYLNTESDYVSSILHPIAEKCVQFGRSKDAVYVYSLSNDYERVLDVLIKELSEALQQSQHIRLNDPYLSNLGNLEILQFANQTLQSLSRLEHFSKPLTKTRTVTSLTQLIQFRELYETQQFEQALQFIDSMNIIPLSGGFSRLQSIANEFERYDEHVKKNMPEILLNSVDMIYKLWVQHKSMTVCNFSELDRLEDMMNMVLTYIGSIKIYIPNDIVLRLNRADVLMASRKKSNWIM